MGMFTLMIETHLWLWQLMPDNPLVRLGVPDRDSDSVHVGPGQAGPRLVPAERLHILTRIRGESCMKQ